MSLFRLALENGHSFTDPTFYSSPQRCPDALIRDIFRPAAQCTESMPLLDDRIVVMRECGGILVKKVGTSYFLYFPSLTMTAVWRLFHRVPRCLARTVQRKGYRFTAG
jgi:hypothetical protein